MQSKQPIGIFDSGIGGLTVLRKLQSALPHEHFVYFADTANLPYGDKTSDQIISYARKTLAWMQNEMGVKLVVAACNTSSATALDLISDEFNIPIVGTIYPMVETIMQSHKDKRIGIIATSASVASRMHENVLRNAGFEGHIQSIACPKFVPIIESGRIDGPELLRITNEYLHIFKIEQLNTLIYGCTHYPWIAETIEQILPSGVIFIDPTDSIAAKVSQDLYKYKLLNTSWDKVDVGFYCSSNPERFSSQLNLLLSIPKPKVTAINLMNAGFDDKKFAVNQ
jgi:glutamate racemase